MPSRSRAARGRTLHPVVLDDFFIDVVEIDYGEEDQQEEPHDDGGSEEGGQDESEGSSDEDEDDDDEEDEEEEREREEFTGGDCGPSAQARVSSVAAAGGSAERANMPTCPVCMEPWTSQGPHGISCIPCGHVYGRSCLERWLTQRGNRSATCPQCGKRFKDKDIINLYAPEVAIPKNELEKQISYLREQNDSLEKKVLHHDKLFEEMTKRQIDMEQRIVDAVSSKRQKVTDHSDGAAHLEPSTSTTVNFSLQNELFLDGARVISIDASNQIILASGRASSVGAEHVLTKISMFSTHEARKIHLPPDTKAVRDMCILSGGSAIFTSLGKRLSLFSMTTDSVVLQCDLPVPGWSCSADVSSSRHIYAGLQNGMLLVFDIRQTARPLHSMMGLSTQPIHTLHSVIDNNGCRKILSASAVGPCMWDADDNQSRPHLLTGMDNQRVCISLACAPPSSDLLVASFRPKVGASEDANASQVYLSQTPSRPVGSGKLGHHSLIRRTSNASFAEGTTCYGNVSEVRMSKSAIIPYGDNQHLFAYGDESLRGVRTWQLPSFAIHADLCSHRQPILDLRYAESPGGGRYLGCLSEEKLQVFRIS
ncbi:E3 ubiquitin-protein ligase RFWD3-like [Panicum miliaceum]|uniref:RING-type E3 ubiquitin transferase n=1 Tax=Panicum miliaceum TaxID=4540 RepID=A0A3L6S8A6_PANMI|nr:E3 ubiquitin-protein ligase RFWD3-like [Panicum miliaceum]